MAGTVAGSIDINGAFLQVLDSLHACGKEASVTIPQDQEKCSTHQERMSVYCETCKESICHNCALFSKEHHGHSFKPLDDIYKKHVEVLQGEVRLMELTNSNSMHLPTSSTNSMTG